MNFNEFKEQFFADVKLRLEALGIDAKLCANTVEKINVTYEAMTAIPKGSNVGVNVNLKNFFESYEDGIDYEELVVKAISVIKTGIAVQPEIDTDSLTDYDQMKNRLVIELISIRENKDLLVRLPHQKIEDMAIIYRYLLDFGADGQSTVLVTNQLLETMGITPEKLHADAVENAPKLKPAFIKDMSEIMAEMMDIDIGDFAGMELNEDMKIFVASTEDKLRGAGVLAYKDFLKQAAVIAGGDFFVLPSSIHELIIVPDNGSRKLLELKEMVREVNLTQLDPEDKLTDSVYHYDSLANIFELGEKFLARQSKGWVCKAVSKGKLQ